MSSSQEKHGTCTNGQLLRDRCKKINYRFWLAVVSAHCLVVVWYIAGSSSNTTSKHISTAYNVDQVSAVRSSSLSEKLAGSPWNTTSKLSSASVTGPLYISTDRQALINVPLVSSLLVGLLSYVSFKLKLQNRINV